jgi:hypothetical protein
VNIFSFSLSPALPVREIYCGYVQVATWCGGDGDWLSRQRKDTSSIKKNRRPTRLSVSVSELEIEVEIVQNRKLCLCLIHRVPVGLFCRHFFREG